MLRLVIINDWKIAAPILPFLSDSDEGRDRGGSIGSERLSVKFLSEIYIVCITFTKYQFLLSFPHACSINWRR